MFKDFLVGKFNKSSVGLLVAALVVGGVGAQASGLLNSPTGGYLMCVHYKTKVITHPGTSTCPKGSKWIVMGAKGEDGADGSIGVAGAVGAEGPQGPRGPQGPGGSGPAGTNGTNGINGVNGTNGSNGANGQGPVFFAASDGLDVTTAGVEAISLSLDAGTYLLTYSSIAYALESDLQEGVACSIENSNYNPLRLLYVKQNAMDGDLNNRKFMTEQRTLTLSAPGTAKVYCRSSYRNGTIQLIQQTFSALKVSSATVQE